MDYPLFVWIVFFGVVLVALFVDVGVVNRKAHLPTRRETLAWSAVWISLALAFNAFVYYAVGAQTGNSEIAAHKAKEFLTGYLIELSLSIDNLFVFLLIFNYFKVPKEHQHRALFWGIFMALVLRLVMIFAGAELVEQFNWILYFFGAFLVYTGAKMFFQDDDAFDPKESFVVRLTTRVVPVANRYDGEKFFVRENGGRTGTLLLLVLIVVNLADLVFAVDSIPAIFGITTDRFIVYTSNIFAILGLRTFYFLLLETAEKFHLLKYALAFVLSFIGVKMLLPVVALGLLKVLSDDSRFAFLLRRFVHHDFEQTLINVSLGVVVGSIALAIIFSRVFPPKA